ncbi:MAG TPA: DUF2934 domain-containing protein [Azospirillaceae bacterium]|nr:DUF2934 domain-containing protein [Azospirillaceae bacterium]
MAEHDEQTAATGAGAEDEQRIRERAYEIWEREGRPEGRGDEHWARACDEVRGTGLGAAAAAMRDANAEPVHIEGGSAGDSEPTMGGAGTSGDLVTPRP